MNYLRLKFMYLKITLHTTSDNKYERNVRISFHSFIHISIGVKEGSSAIDGVGGRQRRLTSVERGCTDSSAWKQIKPTHIHTNFYYLIQ